MPLMADGLHAPQISNAPPVHIYRPAFGLSFGD